MRIILYTGKGGVGKTSIAAATALKLANDGQRVLVMSTDQAHSLGDSFELPLTSGITSVSQGLDAIEIDIEHESELAWGHLHGYLKELLTAKAQGGLEAEELLIFPGLEELFALFKILDIYEQDLYDTLIVDCAPTGETLNLLKFPEMFGSFIDKILPLKRKAVKTAGPLVQKLTKIPMPQDEVFNDIDHLFERLDNLQKLMKNRDVFSIRIVTTPEKIVIREARRNFTYLHLFDINVDAIIVNKVYPSEALDGYFHKWVSLQEEGLKDIEESFRDIPVFKLELKPYELKSIPVLLKSCTFYDSKNPADVFSQTRIFEIHEINSEAFLRIHLPHAEKDEMRLAQSGDELQIAIKNEKRCFLLPDKFRGKEIVNARMENGVLDICFG